MTKTTHRHTAVTTIERCFRGSVSSRRENRAAHGGVCYVERCHCGAERHTNVNGSHEETSGWLTVESDQRDWTYDAALDAEISRVARACAQTAQQHGDYNLDAVPMSQRCRVAIKDDERSFQLRVTLA